MLLYLRCRRRAEGVADANNARRYPTRHYSVRAWSLSSVTASRRRPRIPFAPQLSREGWLTPGFDANEVSSNGSAPDGPASGGKQPIGKEGSRQGRGGVPRLAGESRRRLPAGQ